MTSENEARQTMLIALRDGMTALFDEMSSYFLDHCPEGQSWEDFDGDVDGLRFSLSKLMDYVPLTGPNISV